MDADDIFEGDRLFVDRSLKAVITCHKGKFLVRRLSKQGGHIRLLAENPIYPTVQVKETDDFKFGEW